MYDPIDKPEVLIRTIPAGNLRLKLIKGSRPIDMYGDCGGIVIQENMDTTDKLPSPKQNTVIIISRDIRVIEAVRRACKDQGRLTEDILYPGEVVFSKYDSFMGYYGLKQLVS